MVMMGDDGATAAPFDPRRAGRGRRLRKEVLREPDPEVARLRDAGTEGRGVAELLAVGPWSGHGEVLDDVGTRLVRTGTEASRRVHRGSLRAPRTLRQLHAQPSRRVPVVDRDGTGPGLQTPACPLVGACAAPRRAGARSSEPLPSRPKRRSRDLRDPPEHTCASPSAQRSFQGGCLDRVRLLAPAPTPNRWRSRRGAPTRGPVPPARAAIPRPFPHQAGRQANLAHVCRHHVQPAWRPGGPLPNGRERPTAHPAGEAAAVRARAGRSPPGWPWPSRRPARAGACRAVTARVAAASSSVGPGVGRVTRRCRDGGPHRRWVPGPREYTCASPSFHGAFQGVRRCSVRGPDLAGVGRVTRRCRDGGPHRRWVPGPREYTCSSPPPQPGAISCPPRRAIT